MNDAHEGYPIGQCWEFDIGVARIEHDFVSADSLRYRIVSGDRAGETGTVSVKIIPIGAQRFFVSWQEDDRSTVVHLEDFSTGTFHSCYTSPDLQLFRTTGRMKYVGAI